MGKKLIGLAIWEFIEHFLKVVFTSTIKQFQSNEESTKQNDIVQRTCRHVNSNTGKTSTDELLMKVYCKDSSPVVAQSSNNFVVNEPASIAKTMERKPTPVAAIKAVSGIENASINNKNLATKQLVSGSKANTVWPKTVATVSAKTTASAKSSRLAIQKVVSASKANKVLDKVKTNSIVKKIATTTKTSKPVVSKISNKSKATGSIKNAKNKKPTAGRNKSYRSSIA